jgi:hypothetical protein
VAGLSGHGYHRGVAAIVVYVPRDRFGHQLLDELESVTEVASSPSDYAPMARQFWARSRDADVHAFEPALDKLAPDWRDHVALASPD